MQTMIPSHNLTLHLSNLQTEATYTQNRDFDYIREGWIVRFVFDFKNACFIFVYVSGRQLIAFDDGF